MLRASSSAVNQASPSRSVPSTSATVCTASPPAGSADFMAAK